MIFDRHFLMTLEIDPDKWTKMDTQSKKKAIKKAYHQMAQEYHPDKWQENEDGISYEEQTERFKEIVHAFKMLTDPSYRNSEKTKTGQINLNAIFNINISFEQAFFGTDKTISYNPTHLDAKGEAIPEEDIEIKLEAKVIKVCIPPGTMTGDKVQFRHMGMIQGDEKGDLLFVFNVMPHPKFQLNPGNPYEFISSEMIPLATMLAGGEIEVETIWGYKTARVPAGSRPGDKISIINLGDDKLYKVEVNISPEYPNKEKLQTESLWQKLKINWSKEDELDEKLEEAEKEYDKAFQKLGGFSGSSQSTSGGWFGR